MYRISFLKQLNYLFSHVLSFALILFIAINSLAQPTSKQNNTTGSELFADATFRLKKLDNNGNIKALPIFFYIHDSQCSGCNNELAYIDISFKNASDESFGQPIILTGYNQTQFLSMFKHQSLEDTLWGVQSFEKGLPKTSLSHSIIFTADTNFGIPSTPIVDITKQYFYFTFEVPPIYFQSLGDVIDVEITFGLDFEPNQKVYLRVFRCDDDVPSIPNWYRGDAHYHTYYTQNLAENGLPLNATKFFGSLAGLDWLITTDHSCDFDNYGIGIKENWERLGNEVNTLNTQDHSMVLIRGVELSLNNSAGKTIHSLIYPNPATPNSLPFIGDGKGDTQTSSVDVTMMLDSLEKYHGFCYAAHPFAEKDKLSFAVNGNVWNLSDTLLPTNGLPYPSAGTVICNDTSAISDIFLITDSTIFPPSLIGVQIWNYRNGLTSSDGANNPWDALDEWGISGFSELVQTAPESCGYRFNQNLDVYKVILRRGLIGKNQNPLLKHWKFFMNAGSDAHGSFNYGNTDLTAGLTGNVNDNAIGKLTNLVYCPQGMGLNGENVLEALYSGHFVLSSGPIVTTILTNNSGSNFSSGDDASISSTEMPNYYLKFNVVTTPEYGVISEIKLFGGTENGEVSIVLPVFSGTNQINLCSLLSQLFPTGIAHNAFFYIRAELTTTKNNGSMSAVYKRTTDVFSSYTNPIWIKINSSIGVDENNQFKVLVYPNPTSSNITVMTPDYIQNATLKIFNSLGKLMIKTKFEAQSTKVDVSDLSNGIYVIEVGDKNNIFRTKFVKR